MNQCSLSHSVIVKLFQCQSKRFEQQILSSYFVNSICYLHYAAILKAVRRLLITPYFCLSLQIKQLLDRETKHLCALRVLNTAVTLWQGDACQIQLFTTFEVAAASHQSINLISVSSWILTWKLLNVITMIQRHNARYFWFSFPDTSFFI